MHERGGKRSKKMSCMVQLQPDWRTLQVEEEEAAVVGAGVGGGGGGEAPFKKITFFLNIFEKDYRNYVL
jgi:hypothetical protein